MTYREKLLSIGTVDLCGLVYLDRAEQVVIEADAEIAGLRADAERYRWLREHFRFANDSMYELWFDGTLAADGQLELDAVIDAARANGGAG